MIISTPSNNPDGEPKSQEQIDLEIEQRRVQAKKNQEEFMRKMEEEAKDECSNCGIDITGLGVVQVNPMMRYIPREHCVPCHNLSILGIGPFEHEREFDGVTFTSHPVEKGWMPTIIELNEELLKLHPDYTIVQVKEKFGGLRYYTDGVPLYEGTKEEREARTEARTAEIVACREREEEPDWERFKQEDEALYTPAHNLIRAAEKKCSETCEKCGQPGVLSVEPEGYLGWIQTLCEEHQKELKKIPSTERRRLDDEARQEEPDPED